MQDFAIADELGASEAMPSPFTAGYRRLGAMEKSFIERQRMRLERLRLQLLGPEEAGLARERAAKEAKGDESRTSEDAAQDMTENEIRQALHDAGDYRLHGVERALENIWEGIYGHSDAGDPIPRAPGSVPEAVLTVEEEGNLERRGQ